MTTILEYVIKTFTNPVVLVMLLIGALFFGYTHERHVAENLQTQNAAYEQIVKAKDQSILILQNDFKAMSELQTAKTQVSNRQQQLTVKLNAIPDTSTNHPFTNSDLLNAASVLRTYQQSNPPATSSTNH